MSELDPGTLETTLLEAVPDLVYIVDLRGRMVWWNDRVLEVTGYEPEELSGMDAFRLVPPDQREAAAAAFAAAGEFSPEQTLEFDILTKDGDRIPHEFNGGIVEVDGRHVVPAVARDVTARREREREIRRQRDELATLNAISETVHEVIQAVVEAATREEIERVVCERLAASALYLSVWVGRADPDGGAELATAVGDDDEFAEVVRGLDDLDWERPATVAVETGEVRTVQHIQDSGLPEAVRAAAEELGIRAGTAVPIVHRGNVEGVLCLYSSRGDAFSEREQAALQRLGEVVGFAINAYRTERLLLSDVVTELTLRVTDRDAFMVAASAEADGPVRKEWSTPVEDGGTYRHYVTVEGLETARVRELAADRDTVESVERVADDGDAGVFEVVTVDSFTQRLLEAGGTPTSMVARDGELTIVVEVPPDVEVRPVVEAADGLYRAELASRREVERPAPTPEEFGSVVADRLTDRQRTALRHAYFGGYFSWPREATAEEVADRMGVSSPTFHYHIRRAQRALVEAYLDTLDD